MVKSIISTIVSIIIFIFGCVIENNHVTKNFDEFKESLVSCYKKIENKTATEDDILSSQTMWISKKETLHVYIPHNEIKEIELWLTEAVTLVRNEKWEDALSKIDVAIELVEQIPKTFAFRIENIL